ncbi:MAG: DUF2062 domain-containing protein [Bacteroidota bacterium]
MSATRIHKKSPLTTLLKKRLQRSLDTIKAFLQEGMSADKLSTTILLGLFLGISPMIGLTTIAAFLTALLFKLNMVILQTIQYTLAPIQLILFVPFIKTAKWAIGDRQILPPEDILQMFKTNWLETLQAVGTIYLTSIAIWALLATTLTLLLHKRLSFILSNIKQKHTTSA